jgi:hypothetical protein
VNRSDTNQFCDTGNLTLLAIRMIDGSDQIMKIVVMRQSVCASEPLAEDAKILFGQEADGDDPLRSRLRGGLKFGHRKAATKRRISLCPLFRRHTEKIPVPTPW